MPGSLYLIPATLGAEDWQTYLPTATRHIVCNLTRFIAENAKSARAELKRLGHPVPLRQIDIQQLPERCLAPEIERLLEPLLTGEDVGLFSEAGCPGVADPGASIVRRAHAVGIPVKPLVGPSSLLLALMASGLEGQRFAFHGYLPAREPDRRQRIVVRGRCEQHQLGRVRIAGGAEAIDPESPRVQAVGAGVVRDRVHRRRIVGRAVEQRHGEQFAQDGAPGVLLWPRRG